MVKKCILTDDLKSFLEKEAQESQSNLDLVIESSQDAQYEHGWLDCLNYIIGCMYRSEIITQEM